jgi:hypothetical protein
MRMYSGVMKILLTCALVLGIVAPTSGDAVSRFDPNDVMGPLDIRRFTYDHRNSGKRTLLNVVFYEAVTKRDLRAPDRFVAWLLDTFGDDTLDYQINATARRRNGRLKLFCENIDKKTTDVVRFPGTLEDRKVSCNFPSKAVGGVAEGFTGGSIYNSKIKDLVPNNASTIEH